MPWKLGSNLKARLTIIISINQKQWLSDILVILLFHSFHAIRFPAKNLEEAIAYATKAIYMFRQMVSDEEDHPTIAALTLLLAEAYLEVIYFNLQCKSITVPDYIGFLPI